MKRFKAVGIAWVNMKIERTKNASRNILFGIILKIYQIAVPFLMRTAMIYFMGVQYLGLNSLFTSVLQVLNLAYFIANYNKYFNAAYDRRDNIENYEIVKTIKEQWE